MKFKVKWVVRTEYETVIKADSKENAIDLCMEGEFDACDPTGFMEHEDGSFEAEEITPEIEP